MEKYEFDIHPMYKIEQYAKRALKQLMTLPSFEIRSLNLVEYVGTIISVTKKREKNTSK